MTSSAHKSDLSKRKHIRFQPDPLDFAYVSFATEVGKFTPDASGLIVEEAPFGGCSLALHKNNKLKAGLNCRVKVGRLEPVLAEIVWVRELDDIVVRVGFKYQL